MRQTLVILLLCLVFMQTGAQKVSRTFNDVTLSEALRDLNNATTRYEVSFIYDELEDFRVTTDVRRLSVPDAVRQAVGFYPMRVTVSDSLITVECTHKTDRHLTGTIIDEQSLPVAYANVALLNPADSTLLSGGVSNESGVFVVPYELPQVLARISYVGYKTVWRLCDKENVGTICLQPDNYTLNGVVVKGSAPTFKMGQEGIITYVENTVLSKLGTGEDVLAHVPGLTKKNGAFEVFGKGAPLIYINGRQMRDASELDQLKSEDVKSIELITNPGAKYDASVKAVVKIRTKAQQGEGFGFDVRSSYYQSENTDLVEQLNWNYRHNRLDVFGTFRYTLDNIHYSSITNTLVETDTIWKQLFLQDSHTQKQAFYNVIGTSYAINDDNSLGFRYTLVLHPCHKYAATATSDITANDVFYDHLDNTPDRKINNRPSHLLNVYYRGKIGGFGLDFNADYLYNKTSRYTAYDEQSTDRQSRIVTSDNMERNELLASKLTVDHPFMGGEISVGAECTHTLRNDDYINPEQYVPTSFAELREQHVAPFAEYSRQIARLKLTAGLRYEWVDFDYYENGQHLDEQSRSFGNLFPSLAFGTWVGKVQMQLGYTAKTRRPTYRQLSNNVVYGNRFLLQSGNPLLRHEYIHHISLAGVWKFLQGAIAYDDCRDAIIFWTEQQVGNPAVSRITYMNIPTLKSLTTSLSAAPKFGVWSPELSVSMQKQWLRLHTHVRDYKLNTPIWEFSLDNVLDFGHGWVASANAYLTTKGNDRNMRATYNDASVNVSLTKSLLDDRLSIRLQGNDLFHTQRQGGLLYAGFEQTDQTGKTDSRELALTVSYKFNTVRPKYKGTGAGNDEKKRL